jgi:hypothetical protein
MPLLRFFHAQTMHTYVLSRLNTTTLLWLPNNLAGFEPGSSVSEADATSTEARD